MSYIRKNKTQSIKQSNDEMYSDYIIIPHVDSEIIEPKIKIYDPNDGGYWYREIGFNRTIKE